MIPRFAAPNRLAIVWTPWALVTWSFLPVLPTDRKLLHTELRFFVDPTATSSSQPLKGMGLCVQDVLGRRRNRHAACLHILTSHTLQASAIVGTF